MGRSDQQVSRDEVIRRTIEVFFGTAEPLKIWHPVIFDETETVPEFVKDRTFPIFFGCIRDMALVRTDHLPKLLADAERADNSFLPTNIREIGLQCTYAIDVISSFSEEAQIYLYLLRNRFVHGYLKGSTRDTREFRVITPRKVKDVKKSIAEREEIQRRFSKPDDSAAIFKLRKENDRLFKTYIRNIREDLLVPVEHVKMALEKNWLIHAQGRTNYARNP